MRDAQDSERREAIVAFRRAGYSLRTIGREFHISGERVRQISAGCEADGLVSIGEAARRIGRSQSWLRKRIRMQMGQPPNHGIGYPFLLPEDSIGVLMPHCRQCGKVLPKRRVVYCSDGCFEEARKYENWPAQKKERHRATMRQYWSERQARQRTNGQDNDGAQGDCWGVAKSFRERAS